MTARSTLCSMATANHAWTAAEANAALDAYRDEILRAAAAKIRNYGDPPDDWAANLIDPDKEPGSDRSA